MDAELSESREKATSEYCPICLQRLGEDGACAQGCWRCPTCANYYWRALSYCPNCALRAFDKEPKAPPKERRKFCFACGNTYDPEVRGCFNCIGWVSFGEVDEPLQ